jgi:hypothetical protein
VLRESEGALYFGAPGNHIAHEAPLFEVQIKRTRRRAAGGGTVAVVVVARGALKRRLGVSAMRSVAEIRGAFWRSKCSS